MKTKFILFLLITFLTSCELGTDHGTIKKEENIFFISNQTSNDITIVAQVFYTKHGNTHHKDGSFVVNKNEMSVFSNKKDFDFINIKALKFADTTLNVNSYIINKKFHLFDTKTEPDKRIYYYEIVFTDQVLEDLRNESNK